MDDKQVKKWGSSLAVRFDKKLLEHVSKLKEDDEIVLTYEENRVIIEKK